MSNTNFKELKINVEHRRVVTTLNIMKHTPHILCSYVIAELAMSFDGWGHEEPRRPHISKLEVNLRMDSNNIKR